VRLVLDAGALIAFERADRDVVARIKRELVAGRAPLTHGGVLGQVWRGGRGKQVNLARLLLGLEIVPLDAALGQRAGVLLRRSRSSDVVDAALVLLASDGDEILSADARDLRPLLVASGVHADIVPV
jgi:hypothetical protein